LASASSPSASRAMTIVVRYEATELHPKAVAGGPAQATKRALNAYLALVDAAGEARSYLAESLPQLNSESWRVFADGRMETTYRLRPNLTWHDGTPVSAEDWVFAYRVYTTPGLGAFTSKPQDLIEEATAPDARTLVIRWRSPYPHAGRLSQQDLDAMPRHVLDEPFKAYLQDPVSQDVFMGIPYWTTEYVGLGPFKLERWEPGTSIEASAFAGHGLGRAKIDRVIFKIVPDENTAVTNLLAGSADLATDFTLRFEHGMELKRQWDPDRRGVVIMRPGTRHGLLAQMRPELVKTPVLADVRARRAFAHAIDRDALNEAHFEGLGLMSEHMVWRDMPYASAVDRAVTRYPFDPRRVEQLLNETSYVKDGSGFFANAAGERLLPQLMVNGGPLFERELTLVQNMWARLGIEVNPYILPAAQVRNNEPRNTWPDLYITSSGAREADLSILATSEIGTAARRWAGNNRSGWSNPDFERGWAAFNTSLEPSLREQAIVEMMKVVTDQVPLVFINFNIIPIAHAPALHRPVMDTPDSLPVYNIHEWAFGG
jgi:peptide/nickel transport system substrate-binding protein